MKEIGFSLARLSSAMSAALFVTVSGLTLTVFGSGHEPGFFWLMNGRMSAEKLCAQLDDMKARGLGSVCWHPMPKEYSPSFPTEMAPGYLTDEYMELYAKAADHAAKIGLDFWLYDEGGWSGLLGPVTIRRSHSGVERVVPSPIK